MRLIAAGADANPLAEEGSGSTDVIEFDCDVSDEIPLQIAGERLRRMVYGFAADLHRQGAIRSKINQSPPVAVAPQEFVSIDEVLGLLTASHLLCVDVIGHTATYGGLSIVEWIRGYAVLQKMTRFGLLGDTRRCGVTLARPEEALQALVVHGLSRASADVFLGHATFGKSSSDVFDAPLVKCRDGMYCVLAGGIAQASLALVVFSQLATLGAGLSFKGRALEKEILDLMNSNGIAAANVNRKIGSQEIEIDCVFVWDRVLFVIEAKNYFLPADNPQAEYWFVHQQADAERQVLRKCAAIKSNPDLVRDALPSASEWSEVVPIVLNGLPYSVGGPSKSGVFFYDLSSLRRFFEQGYVSCALERGDGAPLRPLSVSVVPLWRDKPSAKDLRQQLRRPLQVEVLRAGYRALRWEVSISSATALRTVVIERVTETYRSLAEAFGASESDLIKDVASASRSKSEQGVE